MTIVVPRVGRTEEKHHEQDQSIFRAHRRQAGALRCRISRPSGLHRDGKTIDEAIANASDVAREWGEAVAETNAGRLPKPRTAEALHKDPETRAALAEGAVM